MFFRLLRAKDAAVCGFYISKLLILKMICESVPDSSVPSVFVAESVVLTAAWKPALTAGAVFATAAAATAGLGAGSSPKKMLLNQKISFFLIFVLTIVHLVAPALAKCFVKSRPSYYY